MKVLSILLCCLLLIFASCSHVDYPRSANLNKGEAVLVSDENAITDCRSIGNVYGKIKSSIVDTAVENAFNMARNEAAMTQGNVIVYKETKYLKSIFDHAVLIRFSSYYCSDVDMGSSISQSVEQSSAYAQSEATKEAMMRASQQAMFSAQQAAQSAASAAAASAAASSATHMMMMAP